MESRFKYIVAGVVLLVFVMVVHSLSYRAIPEANKEIFIHTTGIIEGAVIAIVTYYFGSSSGSKEKSETIAKALDKKEGG